ncbi:MAG: glycosyltransferase involved in cell wall biosynthesis [Rhodothermales bacterium]|jgi:glycosyltransferase involved in cell wall biosynthesis
MSHQKINLCSMGDPEDRRTWSGTPRHLLNALRDRGRAGVSFDAEISRFKKLLSSALSAPRFGLFDYQRHPLRRRFVAARVARLTGLTESKATLHTGTFSLPFSQPQADQRHYLFCDATWHLWSRASSDMGKYGTRLLAAAEEDERRSYEQAAHIFPIAEYVRRDLIEHYGVPEDRVTAVGTGLGLIRPFEGPKDYSRKHVLFTAKGRFRDKGGTLAVEAFRLARLQDPEITLTVVGCEDGLALEPRPGLTLLGFVPAQDLQELFETHSLFLLPATNEPWGLVYLEAMACGMPIVGLNRNSFPEICDHGRLGWWPQFETPESLSQVLVQAFSDSSRLAEMGSQARHHCLDTYSWEKTVDRMLGVIDSPEKK